MNSAKRIREKWLVSDRLWEEVRPLIPTPVNMHPTGGGHPSVSDRDAMTGIFLLSTGCQWKALDATGIYPGTVAHDRFFAWAKAGVFESVWKKSLMHYGNQKGIVWRSLSLNMSLHKAPIAGSKKTGKNPTDRGEQEIKQSIPVDGRGVPIGIVVAPANWQDSTLLMRTIRIIPIRRPRATKRKPQHLFLDKGYDADWIRVALPSMVLRPTFH